MLNFGWSIPSRYLNFYLDFSGYAEKRLDKKEKVNFSIYDTGKQIITIQILSNISKN